MNDMNISHLIENIFSEDKILAIENKEFILDNTELNLIKDININYFNLDDIFNTFNSIKTSSLLVEINDNKIKYIEKIVQNKDKEFYNKNKNKIFIDFLLNIKKEIQLTDTQFIYCPDYINELNYKKDILTDNDIPNLTYYSNYKDIYNTFVSANVNWINKKDNIYLQTNNKNIFLHNLFVTDDLNTSINKNIEYKYIINFNDSKLSYLFLTKSCIIILKNEITINNNRDYLINFIKGIDYIEIIYSINNSYENIIKIILEKIKTNDCYKIAESSFEKAKTIFNTNSILKTITDIFKNKGEYNLKNKLMNSTIFHTNGNNIYYEDRLHIINNSTEFYYKGLDVEFRIRGPNFNIILKIIKNNTSIFFNEENFCNKYTPQILNNTKYIKYNMSILNKNIILKVSNMYNLINVEMPFLDIYNIDQIDIMTENIGRWIL